MKKVFFLICCAAVLSACGASHERKSINALPEKLTAVVSQADLSCSADADCAAVQKGCCPCAGYASVNVKAAQKIQKVWAKQCQDVPCTRELCYVQITPKCVNNVCQGKLILPKGNK